MHRIAYTKLDEQQILDNLGPAAAAGPASASPLSERLADRSLRIVSDNGPALDYEFASSNRLTLAEVGGSEVEAGYGALTLGHIVLFAHLIPGTQRGFAAIVDEATGLATVFELWFSGYEDKREVQREVHHGFVETAGVEPPAGRHAPTNRFEGKAFHWTQDNGFETIEYYPSVAYSHFVELGRGGEEKLGFCGPSDYIRISEELYIYSRVEAEFSGTLTLAVIDLNRQEQIGLRLGFDAGDELEYYLFRGTGEWLGQIAQFEAFGDESGNPLGPRVFPPPPEGADQPPAKGARAVYRPLRAMAKLTKEEVAEATTKPPAVFSPRSSVAGYDMAGNASPPTERLAGREATLRYDNGVAMEYRFDSAETLRWRRGADDDWTEARYRAWEPMPDAFLFGHLIEDAPDHDAHIVAADFESGLATCFRGFANTPWIANEAGVEVLFGVLQAEGVPDPGSERHGFTDELLGRAITWNYAPGLTSMHLYSTPHSMSWIIFHESGAGGMAWSGRSGQVKIRDGLYFIYWLEEACNGALGTILVNMRTMHDAGIGYHCGPEGLSLAQVGAHSRHAGRFDVGRFFERRTT
jgi:hypothetical protein